MTGQTIELERPERVVEHSPGLTHSLDYGKEGLAVNATRICIIEGCSSIQHSRGCCGAHYSRLKRYGDATFHPARRPKRVNPPRPMGAPVRNTIETFWAQVEVTGACWLWTGGLTDEGYGYYWLSGRTYGAHTIAYKDLVSDVPAGMHLDHLCRIRNCVNPDHLEVVTPAVNSERANKPRVEATHCNHGHEWTPENTLPLGESKRCRQCILVRGHRKRGIECTYESLCSRPSHAKRTRSPKSAIPCPNEPKTEPKEEQS